MDGGHYVAPEQVRVRVGVRVRVRVMLGLVRMIPRGRRALRGTREGANPNP